MRRFLIAGVALAALVLASAALAVTSGWSVQYTPNPPGQSGGPNGSGIELFSVSCPSASACTAVGFGAKGTVTERWNGSRWSIQPTQTDHKDAYLWDVSCLSARFCLAVGAAATASVERGLIERWNGVRWSLEQIPQIPEGSSGPVRSFVTGVSCLSTSDCTAVGSGYGALVWNGTDWSIQHVKNSNLQAVSCVSAKFCMAVGAFTWRDEAVGTLAERWNGSKWSIVHSPDGGIHSDFVSVSCVSARNCTAVGLGGHTTLAERWNGTRWSIEHTPSIGNDPELSAVTCLSAHDCLAVGSYFTPADAEATLSEHWNGAWSVQPTTSGSGVLRAVSCPNGAACTAVGQRYLRPANADGVTLAERWKG